MFYRAGELCWAVVDKDFDYVTYLYALVSFGFKYTRIYPGYLFGPKHKFICGARLGLRPESLIIPWGRGAEPGYGLGGSRIDLEAWPGALLRRLPNFLARAAERAVVVEA